MMNATIASSSPSSPLRRSDLVSVMAKAGLGEVRDSDPDSEARRVPPASDDERGQAVLTIERDVSRMFTGLFGAVMLCLAAVAWWLSR